MEAKEVPLGGRFISISAEVGNCFWGVGSNVEVLVVDISAAWGNSEIKKKQCQCNI